MRRPSRPRVAPTVLAVVLATATAGAINAESASIDASVRVMPVVILLDLSAMTARIGDPVRARATVTNIGAVRLSTVAVELRVDASAVSVKGSLVATISKLMPGHAASLTWSLCPTRAGNNLVLARATVSGASIESQARVLAVTGQAKRAC